MKRKKLVDNVMNMLLKGDDVVFDMLRKQYENATMILNSNNSAGIIVDFEIMDKTLKLDTAKQSFVFGDVYGKVFGKNAVGFIIFIDDGFLSLLDGHNLGDSFPISDDDIELFYDNGEERNFEELKSTWKLENILS